MQSGSLYISSMAGLFPVSMVSISSKTPCRVGPCARGMSSTSGMIFGCDSPFKKSGSMNYIARRRMIQEEFV